jgi:hypothetical protein
MALIRRAVVAGLPLAPGVATAVVLWVATRPSISLSRDGGVFAYIGWQVLHGALPLRDIWDHKPPAVYYVDAIAFVVGRADLKTLQILDLIFGVGFVIAMAWALSRIVSRSTIALVLPWQALAMRVFVEGSTNFTEQFALVPMALSLGCGLRAIAPESRARLAWIFGASFTASLAALFKPIAISPGIALMAALIVLIGLGNRKALPVAATALTGLLIPLVATTVAYAVAGGFPSLMDTSVVYNRLYAPHLSVSLVAQAATALARQPVLLPFPIAVLLLLVAVLHGRKSGWWHDRPLLVFIAVAPALDLAGLLAQGRFYVHDMLLLLPSFGIVVTLAVDRYVRPLRTPLEAGLQRGVAAAAALAVFVLSYPLLLASQQSWPPDWLASDVPTLSAFLAVACPQAESVYVWGAEPEINFLANRRSASRYPYLYPLQMPGYANQRRVAALLADLQASKPCAIVDTSGWNDLVPPLAAASRKAWKPSTSFGGAYAYADFESIYAYVEQNYARVTTPSAAPVYLRR